MKNDISVRVLVFAAASLAVVAASDVFPPMVRVSSAAIAAGCGAVLALLRPPGHQPPGAAA